MLQAPLSFDRCHNKAEDELKLLKDKYELVSPSDQEEEAVVGSPQDSDRFLGHFGQSRFPGSILRVVPVRTACDSVRTKF